MPVNSQAIGKTYEPALYAVGREKIKEYAYAVGETNHDIMALIGGAPEFSSKGGFLLPTRNSELFRWCLNNGLRLVHQMTLMTVGLYNEPVGAYLPSVLY